MSSIRLIDANALDALIENEFDGVCVYDVSATEVVNDFQDIVSRSPTIEAVPVAWLEAKLNDQKRGSALWWSIKAIIDTWMAEREAQ